MHPALIDLLGAVADEARWDASLHGYAASLGADQVGWFVLAILVSVVAFVAISLITPREDPQRLAEFFARMRRFRRPSLRRPLPVFLTPIKLLCSF